MFEEMSAVEIGQAVAIRRKVRRDPIEDHGNTVLVQIVDQVHKILRSAETRGRSKVAGRLVPPRSIKGMLHQRQKFHMSEVHAPRVFSQTRRHLSIGQRTIVLLGYTHPGAKVDFVNRDRCMQGIPAAPSSHPFAVSPVVTEVPNHGRCTRRFFVEYSEGVCLICYVAVMLREYAKFI